MKDMLTLSLFNSITKENFNSKLNSKYAFVETITKNTQSNMKNNTIYGLVINKCCITSAMNTNNCIYANTTARLLSNAKFEFTKGSPDIDNCVNRITFLRYLVLSTSS